MARLKKYKVILVDNLYIGDLENYLNEKKVIHTFYDLIFVSNAFGGGLWLIFKLRN